MLFEGERRSCARESDVGLFSREMGHYRSLGECPLSKKDEKALGLSEAVLMPKIPVFG